MIQSIVFLVSGGPAKLGSESVIVGEKADYFLCQQSFWCSGSLESHYALVRGIDSQFSAKDLLAFFGIGHPKGLKLTKSLFGNWNLIR